MDSQVHMYSRQEVLTNWSEGCHGGSRATADYSVSEAGAVLPQMPERPLPEFLQVESAPECRDTNFDDALTVCAGLAGASCRRTGMPFRDIARPNQNQATGLYARASDGDRLTRAC